MAKTEMIRARVEPELKSQAEEVFSRARFVANRGDHAVLSTGNAASRLAVRCEGSQCRDHRSVRAGPHRRGTHRIHQLGGSQSPARLIPMRLLTTKRFEKDLKRGRKRAKDLDKLWSVVERLLSNQPLDPRQRKHRLSGDWSPCWECHIESDWLLVWDQVSDHLQCHGPGVHPTDRPAHQIR